MTPKVATTLALLALLYIQPLAGQDADDPPARWRGYALAAVSAVVMGGVASLTQDYAETAQTGFCSSRSCITGVSTVLGAGLGFLVGNEFDKRAVRRYEDGPTLDLGSRTTQLDDLPTALVSSGVGLVALTRSGVGLVDADLTHRQIPVTGQPRAATVLGLGGYLLVGTSTQIWGLSLRESTPEPRLLWETGASALESLDAGRVAIAEVGRIRLASFRGNGSDASLLEDRTVATREVPLALALGSASPTLGAATPALWTLVDTLLVARDPVTLEELGRLGLGGRGLHLSVSDRTGVLSLGTEGALIVDLTNPGAPRAMTTLTGMEFAYSGAAHDGRVYVASGPQGVFVFDVSNPTSPVSVGVVRGIGFASYVLVHEGRVHILDRERNELVRMDGSGG